jgi:hypothetical protein
MNMCTNIDKKLIKKFLESNYPVSRIKHNMKFRRAMILDDGSVFILGENNSQSLKYKLLESLKIVFNYEDTVLVPILDEFLPFKP